MKKRWAWALLTPSVLMIGCILFLPLAFIIVPTFVQEGQFTLAHYTEFFSDPFFVSVFLRTIRVAIFTVFICTALALPTAFYISRTKLSRRGWLISLATFPLLTNAVVRAFAWITILGKQGILNQLLLGLGLVEKPLALLYTEGAIVVGQVYLFLPTMLTSLVGVMESISDETVEAANSLGANRWVSFLRVVVPLSMPGVIVGGVLVFSGAVSTYSTPLMLGGNRNMMMSTMIYQQAMLANNWTRASVIAAIMVVTAYVLVGGFNKIAARLNKSE